MHANVTQKLSPARLFFLSCFFNVFTAFQSSQIYNSLRVCVSLNNNNNDNNNNNNNKSDNNDYNYNQSM